MIVGKNTRMDISALPKALIGLFVIAILMLIFVPMVLSMGPTLSSSISTSLTSAIGNESAGTIGHTMLTIFASQGMIAGLYYVAVLLTTIGVLLGVIFYAIKTLTNGRR